MNIKTMNYDDLSEHITEAIAELRRKAYGEGYEQGKFDATLESAISKYDGALRKLTDESPQAKRDRIVERTKKDVEELTECDLIAVGGKKGFRGRFFVVNEEFIVNKDKRTVVCLLKGAESLKVYERGIAKAHPNDCFNVHIGRAISLRRALGLEVPDEYLNAPQPTEVRIGDVVDSNSHFGEMVVSHEFDLDKRLINKGTYELLGGTKIVDDSREEITNGRMYPRMDFNGRQSVRIL